VAWRQVPLPGFASSKQRNGAYRGKDAKDNGAAAMMQPKKARSIRKRMPFFPPLCHGLSNFIPVIRKRLFRAAGRQFV
jgi:hypothetical protein